MAVGWPWRMDLHVQSEALGRVRDLHQPGDAAVVIRIRAHEIGAIGNDVVHVQLVTTDVLADEDRGLDHLAQLAVSECGDATIFIRILEPHVACLVTRQADLQRVGPGVVLARGIQHEVHAVADSAASGEHGFGLALNRPVAPTVDLEGGIAHVSALPREFGERLGCTQSAVVVAVIRAGVCGQARSKAAQELPHGCVVQLARDVPQRDVYRADAHPVVFAKGTLQVVVDALAFERIFAEQVLREHADLGVRSSRAAYVLAGDAHIRADAQHVPGLIQAAASLVDLVEPVVIDAEVRGLPAEAMNGDTVDAKRTRHAGQRTPSASLTSAACFRVCCRSPARL